MRKRARVLLSMLALALLATPCRADTVAVQVGIEHEIYQVHGEFEVPVSRALAWTVLTDYDRLADVVGSLRVSHVERRDADRVMVRQEGVLGAFPFRSVAHVMLEVREAAPTRIAFHDTLASDFRSYRGEWLLSGDSSHVHVDYRLAARPVVAAPHLVGRSLLSHTVHDMLGQVRREMLRRVAQSRTP